MLEEGAEEDAGGESGAGEAEEDEEESVDDHGHKHPVIGHLLAVIVGLEVVHYVLYTPIGYLQVT